MNVHVAAPEDTISIVLWSVKFPPILIVLLPPLILFVVAVPAELIRKFPAMFTVPLEPAKVVPVPPIGANVKFLNDGTIVAFKALSPNVEEPD